MFTGLRFRLRKSGTILNETVADAFSHPIILRHRHLIASGVTALAYGLFFLTLIGTSETELKGRQSNSFEGAKIFSSPEFSSFTVTLDETPEIPAQILNSDSTNESLATAEEQNETEIVEDNASSDLADEERIEKSDKALSATAAQPDRQLSDSVTTAAKGVPTGTGILLDQIARCLPDGVRPRLTKAKMSLQFNSGGSLKTVPRMQIDLKLATSSEISEANLVIQATLQCGPYVAPDLEMANVEIVPDFGK